MERFLQVYCSDLNFIFSGNSPIAMMKYVFCCLILFGQAKLSFSQIRQDTLLVVPGKSSLYFYHIVSKQESLYSLSRKFRVDVKQLASFNHLTLKSPLKLYQLVKIPLNKENLDQSPNASSSAQLTPLFHKVMKGETLYHISQVHDKVPAVLLKRWNHLPGNEVKIGEYLIIGWLNAGDESKMASVQPADVGTPAKRVQKEVVKTKQTAPQKEPTPEKANRPSANKPPTASSHDNSFLNEVIAAENENRNPAIHNRSKKPSLSHHGTDEPVKPQPKMAQTEDDAFSVQASPVPTQPKKIEKKKITIAASKKDTPAKVDSFALMLNKVTHPSKTHPPQTNTSQASMPKTNTPQTKPLQTKAPDPADVTALEESSDVSTTPINPKVDSSQLISTVKSTFQKLYEQQTDNDTKVSAQKGAASWFRSNVKPGSGSYYALCNDLPRGTIVKVINPINQRSVLVKVLDVIPKQKENYNLIIKLSDAAMGDLGVSQSRFWCEIRYPERNKK